MRVRANQGIAFPLATMDTFVNLAGEQDKFGTWTVPLDPRRT
jgi:hypothetical protein